MSTDQTPGSSPDTARAEVTAAAPDITLVRDLHGGTRRVQANAATYLRRYDGEETASWERRRTSTPVFGGVARTASASVGLLFAKPPVLTAASPDAQRIANPDQAADSDWEDLDRQGTHGDVVLKRLSEDAVLDGWVGVLVDFPRVDAILGDRRPTLAEEQQYRLRPYWVRYARSQVVSWRFGTLPGATSPVLTQLVLHETADVDVGEFAQTCVDRYRVLRLTTAATDATTTGGPVVAVTVYEKQDEQAVKNGGPPFVAIEAGAYRGITRIPFALLYAGRTDAPFCATPPLLDVAWMNLAHWRLATAIAYLEELTCFPTPVLTGELARDPTRPEVPAEFRLGPNVLVQMSAGQTGAGFAWAELEGKSLEQLRASLREKEAQIAALGLSFLDRETRAAETAEAKRLDATAEHATLATAAQGIEDGANAALGFHAAYDGLDAAQAPTVAINREFQRQTIDAPMVTALNAATAAGNVTRRQFQQVLVAGQALPADTDIADALAELGAEDAANMAMGEFGGAPTDPNGATADATATDPHLLETVTA